jgi:release factor glutamine methyltransferase
MKKEVYEPREDTFLIEEQAAKYAQGRVLDMGTGTGVLAIEASQKADFVIGADINKDALDYAKKKAEAMGIRNIKFVHSDLFGYFKQNPDKFDLIIFNPPYLPEQKEEEPEIAMQLSGGKKGYELLEKFISHASGYLAPFGRILILFSTLTNKDKVHEILEKYAFNYQKLSEKSFDFETLFVYLVEKSDTLRLFESKGMADVKKIAKGHRGIVYTAKYKGAKAAIKKKRPDSEAVGRMQNEARWLKFLNRKGIGPKFLFSEDDYLVYRFVEGKFIMDFLKKADKKSIRKVLINVLRQCNLLDIAGINKEEMHHPLKHIIVKGSKPVMIDFERVHAAQKPKNVTQFLQFLSSRNVYNILNKKGLSIYKGTWAQTKEKFMEMAKKYKGLVKKAAVKEMSFGSF